MTEHGRLGHDGECGTDVAAYALGALDAQEASAFERHLETCTVCREELTAFQQVVDVLPMAAPPYRAPRGLRRRVMRAAGARPRRRPFPSLRPAVAFGAVAALAVVAVVVVLALGSSSGPSTRVIDARVTGPGTASLRLTGGHGELVVHHLPAPGPGKTYEVWLVHGSGPPSPTRALFGVDASGDTHVVVPGSLGGVSRVLVTPRRAGAPPPRMHR